MPMLTYIIPDNVNIDDLTDALEARGFNEHVHFEIEFSDPQNDPTLRYYDPDFLQTVHDTVADLLSDKD